MLLLLFALQGSTLLHPGPWDVIETGHIYSWTVAGIMDWNSLPVTDGTPITSMGFQPLPAWGSFRAVSLNSPLEAGVWSSGRWELDFHSSDIPDSSYETGIGLIENTDSRNRYSAFLRRPIPGELELDFTMGREDTLGNQHLSLSRGDFTAGGRGWQTLQDGYAFWTGWNPDWIQLRATFAHFRSGGRYWEVMGESSMDILGSGASLAGSAVLDDSIFGGTGHVRLQRALGGLLLVGRGDIELWDGETAAGGGAGLISSLGPLELQAGAAAAPGEDAVFIAVAEAGPLSLMLETDGERLSGGLQSMLSTDFGFLAAGIAADRDSISSTGTLMPRIRWGGSGWIHGGFSWQVTRTDSSTVGTMDLRSLFTLGRFAFIFALEDVLDDYRSYSFGITWSFTDEPPKVIEEEARG